MPIKHQNDALLRQLYGVTADAPRRRIDSLFVSSHLGRQSNPAAAGASRRARRKRAASKKNERWKGGCEGGKGRVIWGHSRKGAIDLSQKEAAVSGLFFNESVENARGVKERGRGEGGGARWKNEIFPWENGILSAPRTSERSASRHTCFSHPPVILRVFRYSRERDGGDGGYGVGYVRLRDKGRRRTRGVERTVSYDFRLAPAVAAAPTAL